jgi:hypothetical protein
LSSMRGPPTSDLTHWSIGPGNCYWEYCNQIADHPRVGYLAPQVTTLVLIPKAFPEIHILVVRFLEQFSLNERFQLPMPKLDLEDSN